MKKNKFSTDGFISKRPSDRVKSQQISSTHSSFSKSERDISLSSLDNELKKPKPGYGSGYFGTESPAKSEEITDKPLKKLSRRQRRRLEKRAAKKPRRLIFRILKWFLILLLLAGLSIGGYAAYKLISAGKNVFQGSIIDIFNNQPLKEDENGRSNFLILGTSEDDPGHQASYLTDSIMVLSVDQDNKNVFIFSVPRDLEVEYGMACPEGYSGKINSYYDCVNDVSDDTDENAASAEQERLSAMQDFVGGIYGIDIQYSVHVNYTVVRDVINAIGGSIDITIESQDSRGQMDSNFDWKCGASYWDRIENCPPSGHYIDYSNGDVTLDAEHALYLAQARGDAAPTYGFERSNFDREVNQRKILVAIRDKALSSGVLTNLGAVTSLIDALGSNLRTNIQTDEIRTILSIASEVKAADIHSLDMNKDGIMGSDGNPAAGAYNYTDIKDYIAKKLSSNPVVSEDAPIVVLNGTAQAGLGQSKADELQAAGYNINYVDSAPDNTYTTTEIYQIGSNSSGTANALSKLFGVTIKTTKPPITVDSTTQFVVVIGSDAISQD